MIRSAIAAFITVCLCFAIMQIPGQSDYVPLPASDAAVYETLPLPGNCPGGVCPLPARSVVPVVPVVQPISQPVAVSATHWTYPGEIRSHLASTHGVNAAGMSTAQAETLHDQLHNGNTTTASRVVYSQPVAYTRVATPVRTTLFRIAPLQRVGNALRGIRNAVSFRRCGG
jgi:hypothetical protein